MNKAALTIRDNAKIGYNAGLRIARKEAALRVWSDVCSALDFPFCASDTRLLNPGESDDGWAVVYDCCCESCEKAKSGGVLCDE